MAGVLHFSRSTPAFRFRDAGDSLTLFGGLRTRATVKVRRATAGALAPVLSSMNPTRGLPVLASPVSADAVSAEAAQEEPC